MEYFTRWLSICVLSLSLGFASSAYAEEAASDEDTPKVRLNTTLGAIEITLEVEKAPKTVRNFWRYAKEQFYDGLIFHRVIPDYTIQAGSYDADLKKRRAQYAAIKSEADNGLQNLRGTVAMARRGSPHSARSQFFINIKDNAILDHKDKSLRGWGYTVFGTISAGMDVVDAIQGVDTEAQKKFKYMPVEAVVIESVELIGMLPNEVEETAAPPEDEEAGDEMLEETSDEATENDEEASESDTEEAIEDEEDALEDEEDAELADEEGDVADDETEAVEEEAEPAKEARLTAPSPQPKPYRAAQVPRLPDNWAPEPPDMPAAE